MIEFEVTERKISDFVNTEAAVNAFLAMRYAHAHKDISLIYGEAGTGKTYALKEYARLNDNVVYVEARDCDRTTKGICERILKTLGKTKSGTDRTLIDAIVDAVKGTDKMIVIDEAQHLTLRAVENIRAINDDAKIGIVLCGNPTVHDRMYGRGQAHFAQLYSRIGMRRAIEEPSVDDIQLIFSNPNLDEASAGYLHAVSHEYGGLRNAVKVYLLALDLAESKKEALALEHFEFASNLKNGH